MKFRKKGVEIEAVKYNGFNIEEIENFVGKKLNYETVDNQIKTTVLYINTLEGDMKASPNDYIIKGIKGEFYPCKPNIFEATYKSVDTFIDRLKIEYQELMDRLEKCASFVDSEKFRDVVKDDYSAFLLSLQRDLMGYYLQILSCRINIADNITENIFINKMSFGIAIQALKFGLSVAREGWNGKNLCVFKQVPAHIGSDIIPKMQSLPDTAKEIILGGNGFIDYTSQCLIYNKETGRADSWVPSISDVFAEDWYIVKSEKDKS